MASTSKSSLLNEFDNDDESYFNSDKVIGIINLLTKHKIKLWELPNLTEKNSNTDV